MVSKRLVDEFGLFYFELNGEPSYDMSLPTIKCKSRIYNKIQMPARIQDATAAYWCEIALQSTNEFAFLTSSHLNDDSELNYSNRNTHSTTL